MRKRTLGKTGLEVSELALGGLFISSYGADYNEAERVIRRALKLGINYIDTAPGYLDSEEVLGKVLPRIDEPYILSTKLGYKPEPYQHQDRDFLKSAFEASLKRLRRDSVDILMIHEPDRPDMAKWWPEEGVYSGPVTEVLEEARETGKAKFTGLGGTTAYEMTHVVETGQFDVLLTAFQYDMIWREAEHSLLPEAKKQEMGVIIGSPLHQGALAKVYAEDIARPAAWLSLPRVKQFRKLYELVKDVKMTLPELAMRWLLADARVSTILTGVRSVAELEQNVATVEKGPLPAALMKDLAEIANMVPFRPYNEPLGLPFKA
jgi:aryl-alcohol dehydrogenase-like predicted oxidoreductase